MLSLPTNTKQMTLEERHGGEFAAASMVVACTARFFCLPSGRSFRNPSQHKALSCLSKRATSIPFSLAGQRIYVRFAKRAGEDEPSATTAENSEERAVDLVVSTAKPGGVIPSEEDLQKKESSGQDDNGETPSQLRKERVTAGLEDPSNMSNFWQGVLEEIRLIEWPSFQKVLGTTGVVVGIILGSSLVLLTVNAILAELADSIINNPTLLEGAKAYLDGSG